MMDADQSLRVNWTNVREAMKVCKDLQTVDSEAAKVVEDDIYDTLREGLRSKDKADKVYRALMQKDPPVRRSGVMVG